jgi:hypothetical protein
MQLWKCDTIDCSNLVSIVASVYLPRLLWKLVRTAEQQTRFQHEPDDKHFYQMCGL